MSSTFKDQALTFYNQDLQLQSKVFGIFTTTALITYTAINIGTTQTQTTSLKGVRAVSGSGTPPAIEPGDVVIANPTSALGAGVALAGAYISAANTLTVALAAATTTTPGGITFQITIIKMGQNDGINS
jgi:hypothetical protein